jgi:hypothetical protein
MDFNFVDETPEDDEETLDLSDLYEDEEWCNSHNLILPCVLCHQENSGVRIAGMDISFEEEVPEALSITDPEVLRRARKGRKRKASKQYNKRIGFNRPYVHGLCKQGVSQDAVTKLPAHHSVCQMYEEWNVRAGIPCACTECNHPQTLEELTHGKDARKTARKSRGQRVRSEPKSLSRSFDEEFILVID